MQTAFKTLSIPLYTALLTVPLTPAPAVAAQAKKQPNIVVIFGSARCAALLVKSVITQEKHSCATQEKHS